MGANLLGKNAKWDSTNDAGHVYGLARNVQVATAGTTAVEFFGFAVSIAGSADWSITPVDGVAVTNINSGTFVAGREYSIHGTSIIVPASAEVVLFI